MKQVFGAGGQNPNHQPGIRPPNYLGSSVDNLWWQKFRPPETGSGRFFLADPKIWGSLAPPPMGVGGRRSCRSVDLVEGYAQKNFCRNLTRGFREKWTFHFSPWAPLWATKERNGHRYILFFKVLNTRRDRTRGNVVAGERGCW